MSRVVLTRVSPVTTVQDRGRPCMLAHGIGASGPMDRDGYRQAAIVTGKPCGSAIEFGPQGLDFTYSGPTLIAGLAGGQFGLAIDGTERFWPTAVEMINGTSVAIRTGTSGNYGYVRFTAEIDVPKILGSRSTNMTVGLGGLEGRALRVGDQLGLAPLAATASESASRAGEMMDAIRFVWGIHADLFAAETRTAFIASEFRISSRMNRMGVRLDDMFSVFGRARILGLVSDAVLPGDIQILGDGTPIVLMRDNQPTGGYPRIGTIIDADLDRFAQMRPGQPVRFGPITVENAHKMMRRLP